MEQRVLETIQRHRMLHLGDTVLAAVSGGADSMALVSVLYKYREKLGIRLVCAHVEHGLRGDESVRDMEFVRAWCNAHGVQLYTLSIRAAEEAAAQKMGVEEYARMRRYAFFESIACDKIATAHTKSDNVETMLFRLARGTSPHGLCGIPPVRGKIIRPLLDVSGQEVRAYCAQEGIRFVTDSTNEDDAYSRNYVRHVLVPAFEKLNPAFLSAAASLQGDVALSEQALDGQAQALFQKALGQNGLEKAQLLGENAYVVKKVISRYAASFGLRLNREKLEAAYALLFKNARTAAGGGYMFVANKAYIHLTNFSERPFAAEFEQNVITYEEFVKNAAFYQKEFDFLCDYDKIKSAVSVRGRMPGDRLTLNGRNCTKSLKKYMNELQIPVEKRASVPVVCDGSRVIGLAGYAVDACVAICESTKKVLLLKIRGRSGQ